MAIIYQETACIDRRGLLEYMAMIIFGLIYVTSRKVERLKGGRVEGLSLREGSLATACPAPAGKQSKLFRHFRLPHLTSFGSQRQLYLKIGVGFAIALKF